jgi:hypothetical protein
MNKHLIECWQSNLNAVSDDLKLRTVTKLVSFCDLSSLSKEDIFESLRE